MRSMSLAQALKIRFSAIPRTADGFCKVAALNRFVESCRQLCVGSVLADKDSSDSAIVFAFADGSALDIGHPLQRVYPACISVKD